MLVALVPAWSGSGADELFNVRVVINESVPDHLTLLSTLNDELEKSGTETKNIYVDAMPANGLRNGQISGAQTDLLVTVGTEATLFAAESGADMPVLSVLIPRVSFDAIYTKYIASKNGQDVPFSSIFIDQPFERRFALARLLLPEASTIAVLLGPDTDGYIKSLRAAAQKSGFRLNIKVIENEAQLVPALESILKSSQLFMAILDPLVFNRANAQTALLTSYRYRVPIFGISPAYINAGALVAVYSTPEQIGKQLAGQIIESAKNPSSRKSVFRYPDAYSIKTNKRVAESLGINMPEDRELEQRLLKLK